MKLSTFAFTVIILWITVHILWKIPVGVARIEWRSRVATSSR